MFDYIFTTSYHFIVNKYVDVKFVQYVYINNEAAIIISPILLKMFQCPVVGNISLVQHVSDFMVQYISAIV